MANVDPYVWDGDDLNIPHGNINLHADLCYALLHVRNGRVGGLEISAMAMQIIGDCQKPLLDIIKEQEDEIESIYQDAAGADM